MHSARVKRGGTKVPGAGASGHALLGVSCAFVCAVLPAACGGGEQDLRDGRLEVTALFLSDDVDAVRVGVAGLRMCAEDAVEGEKRCVDVPLPDDDLVVSLNVPPSDEWMVRVRAFDFEGNAVWSGRTMMRAFPGESSRAQVLLSRSSNFTPVPCAPGLSASACGMSRPRAFHTMNALPDGRVLIAGGFFEVSREETCDPVCAIPNPSGQGGFTDEAGEPCLPLCRLLLADDTAEIYDPILGRVTQVIELARPRAMHTTTPTDDGRHLILAGGVASARLYLDKDAPLVLPDSFPLCERGEATAEVLHSFLLSSVREVALGGPRFLHDAVDDELGGVLLIGGMTVADGSVRMVEGQDRMPPPIELVAPEGSGALPMTDVVPRRGHRAHRRGSEVFVVGGNDVGTPEPGPFAEVHDLETNVASPLGDPDEARPRQRRYAPMWLSLTPLQDGRLMALGGHYESDFVDREGVSLPPLSPLQHGLLLDLDSPGAPSEIVRLLAPRSAHTATLMEDGGVLVTGGLSFTDELRVARSVERIEPDSGISEALIRHDERPLQLNGPRFGHAAILLEEGTVLRSGGLSTIDPSLLDGVLPCEPVACDLEIYNPASRALDPPVSDALLD